MPGTSIPATCFTKPLAPLTALRPPPPVTRIPCLARHAGASQVFHFDAKCVTFTSLSQYNKSMAKIKIATLNLRIDPGVKEAVREAADKEHRSVANMVEMLIRRHCDHTGIVIPDQSDMFPGKQNG